MHIVFVVAVLTPTLRSPGSTFRLQSLHHHHHRVSELGFVNAIKAEVGEGGARTMMLYSVPALAYALYNNFAFIGLQYFDPPTYSMLGQIRICITALISRVVFTRELTGRQWIGILLLTVGCAVKEGEKLTSASAFATAPLKGYAVLLFQVLASTSAGIANEKLLKGSRGHVNVQNCYMCINSLFWNALFVAGGSLLGAGAGGGAGAGASTMAGAGRASSFSVEAFSAIVSNPFALGIMLNNALIGLAVGYFLKHLDMVLKAVAAALQIIVTVILSYNLFGTPLTPYSLASMCIISSGIWMYSVKPQLVSAAVVPQADAVAEEKVANSAGKEEKETLLDSYDQPKRND